MALFMSQILHEISFFSLPKDIQNGLARVRRPGTNDYKDFTFDAVYDETAVQTDFYEHTGYAIVTSSVLIHLQTTKSTNVCAMLQGVEKL